MMRVVDYRNHMSHEYGVEVSRVLSMFPAPAHFPFESAVVEILQGQSIRPHDHHENELFLVLQGEGTMQVGTMIFEVKEGQAILLAPFETHTIHNSMAVPMKIVSIWWAGTWDSEKEIRI